MYGTKPNTEGSFGNNTRFITGSVTSAVQFLEAHFNEGSAEDLCNAITSLVQSTDESVYAYVMRTIEIRQKILLASQKATGKGKIGFDKGLVMKLFLRTLERGIISQYVVAPPQKE